jgi:hypothetical protein
MGQVIHSMVGAEGFEPPTLCSQSRCATRLRYAPTTHFPTRAPHRPTAPHSVLKNINASLELPPDAATLRLTKAAK